MQALGAMQDKNTFSYVCNLGLKVSRADSGRNGKFIKVSSFCSLMHSGQLRHLLNAPTINSITCIDIGKCFLWGN